MYTTKRWRRFDFHILHIFSSISMHLVKGHDTFIIYSFVEVVSSEIKA